MSFSFTDEQEEFRAVLRRFLEDKSPPTEVRRLMATDEGYDPEVWQAVSQDLGLPGIHLPEEFGGQGFGFIELGIVMEEMGRALLCSPFLASPVLAGCAIQNTATVAQKRELLPDIASGAQIASLAYAESSGSWAESDITCVAESADGGFKLSGEKHYVLDGMTAQRFVVAARTPGTTGTDGLGLYWVDATDSSVQRTALNALDPTRKLAKVTFRDTPAMRLGDQSNSVAAITQTLRQACVALASENVGGAQAMLDSAVNYTLTRVQFGRLIGSFQAIKHTCAEFLLDVELAKSGAYYAAAAATDSTDDFAQVASLAKAGSSDTFMRSAAQCIQLHGGIGFTWEQNTHLWYKRAKSSEVFLGTPDYHRELMMQSWISSGAEAEQ